MIWVQTLPSNLFAGRNKCILTSNAVVQDASTTATSNKQQATSNKQQATSNKQQNLHPSSSMIIS
jgi:hypothetical protein